MNKNTLINLFMFAAGAAIGSVVTLRLVETKYAQIAQDEIDEMREYYEEYICELEGREADADMEEEGHVSLNEVYGTLGIDRSDLKTPQTPVNKKPDLMEYVKQIKEHQYNIENMKEEKVMNEAHIRVVSPEEFDDSDFDKISLTYYSDEVLAYDDSDEVIDDVDDIVGHKSLNTFGQYEEDTVYVLDFDECVGYEICKDYRPYSDVC